MQGTTCAMGSLNNVNFFSTPYQSVTVLPRDCKYYREIHRGADTVMGTASTAHVCIVKHYAVIHSHLDRTMNRRYA